MLTGLRYWVINAACHRFNPSTEDFSGIPYVMADKVGTPEFFAQIPPELLIFYQQEVLDLS